MKLIEGLKITLNVFESLACITGFIYWKKVRHNHWRWFPIYLLFIVFIELLAKLLTYLGYISIKVAIYKYLSIPTEILFFLIMFGFEFRKSRYYKVSILSIIIYIISTVTEMLFSVQQRWFLTISYTIGILLLVINILIFLFGLMTNSDKIKLKKSFVFWVSVGLLLFYLGSVPFEGIYEIVYREYQTLFPLIACFIYGFDCLMYLSFIIAFSWKNVN
jgi:hypothetical protein